MRASTIGRAGCRTRVVISNELIKQSKNSQDFVMQACKSSDVAGHSDLLAFVRHIYSNQVEEGMLCANI
jgi:hypothetical protein